MIKELIFHTIYKTLKNTSVVGSEIIRKTMLYLLSMPENRDILQQISGDFNASLNFATARWNLQLYDKVSNTVYFIFYNKKGANFGESKTNIPLFRWL